MANVVPFHSKLIITLKLHDFILDTIKLALYTANPYTRVSTVALFRRS